MQESHLKNAVQLGQATEGGAGGAKWPKAPCECSSS